jgi:hypothetical protein
VGGDTFQTADRAILAELSPRSSLTPPQGVGQTVADSHGCLSVWESESEFGSQDGGWGGKDGAREGDSLREVGVGEGVGVGAAGMGMGAVGVRCGVRRQGPGVLTSAQCRS